MAASGQVEGQQPLGVGGADRHPFFIDPGLPPREVEGEEASGEGDRRFQHHPRMVGAILRLEHGRAGWEVLGAQARRLAPGDEILLQ